jgi:hypothetical protein
LLADRIISWHPTHLLVPSASDTHPDHSGLALLLRLAFDDFLPRRHQIQRLEYLVHGASATFAQMARDFPQSLIETRAKQRAIARHVTQVALSRRRFLAYAKRPERFVIGNDSSAPISDGPVESFEREPNRLRLQVAFAIKPLREETFLFLIGHDPGGDVRRLRATLPGRTARLDLIDCETGVIAGVGAYRGDAFRVQITLPTHNFAPDKALHLKFDRRVWFFDEAGWAEIGPLLPESVRRSRPAPTRELAVA